MMMMNLKIQKSVLSNEKKVCILIFTICFIVFLFTSNAHRYTIDDYLAYSQGERIINQTPLENFVPGQTRPGLDSSIIWYLPICTDAILCSGIPIGYSISFIPFIFIEQNLNLIPNYEFTSDDFDDPHYVWWRNSLSSVETFVFLTYGPIFTSISCVLVFLITRTFEVNQKISLFIAFLFGFATLTWAYSSTGLNVVLSTTIILTAFYCFRMFEKKKSYLYLFGVSLSIGFSFLVRYDLAIFGIILLGFLSYIILKQNRKIQYFSILSLPILFMGLVFALTNLIQFGSIEKFGYINENGFGLGNTIPIYEGIAGLLFSPGAGLFVFSPILLTIFISFYDFRKYRISLVIFLSYFISILFFIGGLETWHGFVSWGARYMVPLIPFLLIPLAISIQNRTSILFRIGIITSASIGAFFNFMWLVQDVSWFVWGLFGTNNGLYRLGIPGMHPLNLNPVVFWTFEHSQLTQSIYLAFTHLQVDLYLYKILGPVFTGILLIVLLIPLLFFLKKLSNNQNLVTN